MTSSKRFHRRDYDQQIAQSECQGQKEECSHSCTPSCNTSQTCIFNNNCSNNSNSKCSSTICVGQLKLTAAEYHDNNSQTALIAGLTTGLVVTVLIVVTIAGFVFYKRRQYNKNIYKRRKTNKRYKIETPLQIPPYYPEPEEEIDNDDDEQKNIYPFMSFTQSPDSPFIIGAQSLQIPHLPDPPPPTLLNNKDHNNNDYHHYRRSLNIPNNPSISSFPNYYLNHSYRLSPITPALLRMTRSSSLKLTKYDYYYNNNSSTISTSTTTSSYDNNNRLLLLTSPSTAHLPSSNSSSNSSSNKFSFYFCPPQQSQSSLQSNSTVGDGEITIYWDPGPPRSLN